MRPISAIAFHSNAIALTLNQESKQGESPESNTLLGHDVIQT
jgi:hypothetical protein